MPINIDEIIMGAFERAFVRALGQVILHRAEEIFAKAFANGSPLAERLEEKIEQGLQRFLEHGIRWDREVAGFTK